MKILYHGTWPMSGPFVRRGGSSSLITLGGKCVETRGQEHLKAEWLQEFLEKET